MNNTDSLMERFQAYRDNFGVPINKTAELAEIDSQKLYRFSSGNGDLRNDDAVKLHKFLLTYEEKK